MKTHNKTKIFSLIFILSSFFLSWSVEAGIYKWTDNKGQIHYSQQPGNTNAEEMTNIKTKSNKSYNYSAEEKDTGKESEKKTDDQASNKEKAEDDKLIIPKKERDRLCKQAKKVYAKVSTGRRIRVIGNDGEYRYLSEEQRLKRLSDSYKSKKKYCR